MGAFGTKNKSCVGWQVIILISNSHLNDDFRICDNTKFKNVFK